MKRILQEPLVHFLLLGAVLFAAGHYFQSPRDSSRAPTEIRLSLDDIKQQALLFEVRWNRAPTQQELAQLMESTIQEEVLYREALALGIDKDDTIIKRRLAQKMQFLAEDAAAAREPNTIELRDWFTKNAMQFAMPPRYSFRHLYFSPDRRGKNAHDDAARALAQLAGQPEDSKIVARLADPFMYQDYYRDRPPDFLAKEFGPQFAQGVVKIAPGSWQGPIESGFGWHLVFVDTLVPGRVPDFEEVIPEVKTAWLAERQDAARREAYRKMRAKYTVLLPAPPEYSAAAAAEASRTGVVPQSSMPVAPD